MKQTQTEMVYDMLRSNSGGITAMDVQDELGVMRLAARIYDLRSGGHNIITETKRVLGRYGFAYVAKYRLVK
jgi:hypothetical protein